METGAAPPLQWNFKIHWDLEWCFSITGQSEAVRAAGRTSCSRMPVVSAILSGCHSLCLVDTGSERTLVSPRVVEGYKLRPDKAVLTAEGKAFHVKGQCRVYIGLQGHCFGVTAPVS